MATNLQQVEIASAIELLAHAGFVKPVNVLQALQSDKKKSPLGTECRDGNHVIPHEALATAVLNGHLHTMRIVLDQGLNIEASSQFGTPLCVASLKGHEKIAETLFSCGANGVNSKGYEAAARHRHLSTLQLLAKVAEKRSHFGYGSDVDLALKAATTHGHLPVVDGLFGCCSEFKRQYIIDTAREAGQEHYAEGFDDPNEDFSDIPTNGQ